MQTLSVINGKVTKIEKLKLRAIKYASAALVNNDQAAYNNFSRKYADLSVTANKLYAERLPLLRANQEAHEKTPIGQFLKSSAGLNGAQILTLAGK